MGRKSKIKEQRRLEREAEERIGRQMFDMLQRAARRQVVIGTHYRNHLQPGESIGDKLGFVPAHLESLQEPPDDPKGIVPGWRSARLKEFLALSWRLPDWPTHMTLTFAVDNRPKGPVRHLAVTQNVPIEATPEQIRIVAGEYLRQVFPPGLVVLWFWPGADVRVGVVAGEPVEGEDGQMWTPVTSHFYTEE